MKRYDATYLKKAVEQVLICCGMKQRHAMLLTSHLIQADAYGVHSHGLAVLPDMCNGYYAADMCWMGRYKWYGRQLPLP